VYVRVVVQMHVSDPVQHYIFNGTQTVPSYICLIYLLPLPMRIIYIQSVSHLLPPTCIIYNTKTSLAQERPSPPQNYRFPLHSPVNVQMRIAATNLLPHLHPLVYAHCPLYRKVYCKNIICGSVSLHMQLKP